MRAKSKTVTPSGISDQPTILPYPTIPKLDDTAQLGGMFCYIVKHYGRSGLACLIANRDGKPIIQIGDWSGRIIDLGKSDDPLWPLVSILLDKHLAHIVSVVEIARVQQAIIYLAAGGDPPLMLVDVRLTLNKLAGPGMIDDIFGKAMPVQEVIDRRLLDNMTIAALRDGHGKFTGNVIIKPSRFRCAPNSTDPLYAEVVRC